MTRSAPLAILTLVAGVAVVALPIAVGPAAPAHAAEPVDLHAVRRLLEADEPGERAAAVRRLAGRTDDASVRLAVATLLDRHPYVRRAAAGVLGVLIDPAARGRLLRDAAGWREPLARAEACRAWALWSDDDGRTALLRALADSVESVRAEAARFLGDDPDPAAAAALHRAASADRSGWVRALALDGLAKRPREPGGLRIDVVMSDGLSDGDARVRLSALEGTVAAGGEAASFAVAHGLTDAVWSVRLAAAESAGAVRTRAILAPLVAALADPRDCVARAAGRALVEVTGIPFDPDPARWKAWLATEGRDFDPAVGAEHERPETRRAGRVYVAGGSRDAVRFYEAPVRSNHVAFVLDASGSMAALLPGGGRRWDEVRRELDRVLEALGTAAEGNVILFDDGARSIFPKSVRFAPGVRQEIHERLAARAPSGRTALYDGIALALADPAVDTLLVLSDGAPSAGEFFTKTDLRAELRRANRWRKARIDVVSIGSDEVAKRWRSLLRDLAQDHGGTLVQR